jgi:hypothetical protein
MEVNGQFHAPVALPPEIDPRYPRDKKLGGPQSRSGRGGENENPYPCRESKEREGKLSSRKCLLKR